MSYTGEQFIEKVERELGESESWREGDFIRANTFYLSESVSMTEVLYDSEEYGSCPEDIIACILSEYNLIKKGNLSGVMQITRKEPYYTNNEISAQNSASVEVFEKYSLSNKLGSIIDIDVSLSNYEHDMAGMIDILTYKKDTNELFMVKVSHNFKETFLRAVLEIQTHYQTADKEKLVEDFYSIGKIPSVNPKIKKAIVFFEDSAARSGYWSHDDFARELQIDVLEIESNQEFINMRYKI